MQTERELIGLCLALLAEQSSLSASERKLAKTSAAAALNPVNVRRDS